MKRLMIASTALFTLLTAVQPVLAQNDVGTSTTSIEDESPQRLSDLGVAVNPQIGVSSFDYSEGVDRDAESELSGGVTFEFGGKPRKLETGLLMLSTAASKYLAVPMVAKLRLVEYGPQAWYAKVGATSAFEVQSDSNRSTNNFDVLANLGIGGRFDFTRSMDFIVEATYNRGLMDAIRTATGDNFNQGFLVLAGVSIGL